MADLATIQKIRDQLVIEGSEEGWHWETDDFCCEDYLPSREAALADFNQFVTSGELDMELARPRYNVQDLDEITRQALQDSNLSEQARGHVLTTLETLKQTAALLSEGGEPEQTDPDLFAEMDKLEGNLSMGQIVRLREQVLIEGAGFSRYVEMMRAELYGVSA